MKKIFLIASICLFEPVQGQWSYLGLSGTQVSNLTICSDTIYASTYDGMYKKHVLSVDSFWIPCGMQKNHVVHTLVPNSQTFICLVEIDSTGRSQLYKSTNGGTSFALMDTSVGQVGYKFLHKLAHPEGNYDTLYAISQRRKTFDGGVNWDTLGDIAWGHFVEVNPVNHSQIIVGGEGLALNAVLQSSSDYGNTWVAANMNGYFAGDNALHALALNGNDWFGAGEGVICRTTDGGDNWNQLLNTWSYPGQWQLYIFDIEFSPADKNKIYATGNGRGTYNVPLLYSADYGTSWDTLSYPSTYMPQILALAVKNTANGDRVFLGGRGVFSYENIFTGVRDPDVERLDRYSLSNNYPNPFNPSTSISFSIPIRSHIHLRVFNVIGQLIATLADADKSPGSYSISWNPGNLPGGIYFYRLDAGKFRQTKKMVLMR